MNRYFSKEDIYATNKHMKESSSSLVIREMQIKTTLRYHLMPVRKSIIEKSGDNRCREDVEKQEHFYTVAGSLNQFNHCRRQCGNTSRIQNQKQHLKIPLLGIYPKNYKSFYLKTHAYIVFIATLLTIAKTWNQPRCSSVIDWIKKMWHIYTMEYYSAIKKNKFTFFVGTWIKLETIILSKLTQEQKTKHHMFSLVSGC